MKKRVGIAIGWLMLWGILGITPLQAQEEVENKTASGKVGFAVNYNGKPAAEVEAITNALQSYEDGIFRIFMDDTETGDLSSPIQLKEESTLTFIRLAMLSGRLW
jgi:hypothetical protein